MSAAPPDALPGPTTPGERIAALDVVRGLAVLGILAMNIVEFGLPMRAYDDPAYAGGSTGRDLWTWLVQAALFDGRMRALFSMLFGAGIVLLGERMVQKGRGGDAADLLLRRCLWLIPFGIAHRFLLQWTGDILYIYGLLGALCVAMRGLRPRTQLIAGLIVLLGSVPGELRTHAALLAQRDDAAAAARLAAAGQTVPPALAEAQRRWTVRLAPPPPEQIDAEVAAIREGWVSAFAHRWDHNHRFQSGLVYGYFFFDVGGMLLIGMALLRLGFFTGRLPARLYWAAVALGLAGAVWSLLLALQLAGAGFSRGELGLRLLTKLSYAPTRLLTALGWAAALILLVRSGRLLALQAALGAVGRMAFSNYVLQTVCCTLLFQGYGLGLYGSFSRAGLMLVWAAVSLVQVAASLLWLRRFRMGPLEWAWRSLVWWRRQPLRLLPSPVPAAATRRTDAAAP